MTDESLQEFLNDMVARDEADTLARATGWLVRSTDLEFPEENTMFVGPFENVADAFSYADRWGGELNDEGGYRVDVVPVMPIEPAHDPR